MNNLFKKIKEGTINEALTHGSIFHADDVFSTALITLINPKISVKRAFEVPEGFSGIVYDIGMGQYDHHQEDKEIRENGVPYASFGLLWRELGEDFFVGDKKAADAFDTQFVQPLDSHDNGGERNTTCLEIGLMNPNWDEDCSQEARDKKFFEAVEFAKRILSLKRESVISANKATAIVENALRVMGEDNSEICVLQQFVPWQRVLIDSNAKYVVFPSARGGWNAQAVPVEAGSFETKLPFPEEWRGKQKLELLCMQDGLTFCHPSGFLIATDTEEQAINACKKSLEREPRKGC